jgi:hypothetical protein
LITAIWDTFQKLLWTQCNNIIYGTKETTKQEQQKPHLIARLKQCYSYQDKLDIQDRTKIFHKDKEELMAEDHRYIKAWLKLAERIIRVYKKGTKAHRKRTKHDGSMFSMETNHLKMTSQTQTNSSPKTQPKTRLTNTSLPSQESSVRVYYPSRVTR